MEVYEISESQWDPKSLDCRFSGEQPDCEHWGGDATKKLEERSQEEQDKIWQMNVGYRK